MVTQGFFSTRQINPSRDLDEDMLTQLAESTGGRYFRARDTQALQKIYATLDKLEPIEGESQQLRPLTALFYIPLGLALLISALLATQPLLQWLKSRYRRNQWSH
jgi:Ca-activated chloride channel family protein